MQIEGDVVLQGDKVWHDRYGEGEVIRVMGKTCEVKFNGSNVLVSFTDGGYQGGTKTLYWSNPFVFSPRKGQDLSQIVPLVLELVRKIQQWEGCANVQ